MKQLSEADLLMLLGLINRLLDTKAKEREGFFRFIYLRLNPNILLSFISSVH